MVILLGDCSEEGNLTSSVSGWWRSQAELGPAAGDAFMVVSRVGQEAIV